MRAAVLMMVAALPLAACATRADHMVEAGVPRGSLAVAAIDRGDLGRAEQLLVRSTLDDQDPARLINLGYVYHEQGRHAEAVATWRAALAAPRHRAVETMSGREVRTDQLLREILARRQTSLASAR